MKKKFLPDPDPCSPAFTYILKDIGVAVGRHMAQTAL